MANLEFNEKEAVKKFKNIEYKFDDLSVNY